MNSLEGEMRHGNLGELADHAAARFADAVLWESIDDGAAPTPDMLMSIQYASGTTGFPKGCMLPQD
jgi:long-subunit acyl-CoA synthetase (AMP-forming)